MRKSHREGEAILSELGLRIVERGHGKHHWWLLELPDGRRIKQPIPHNTTEGRFWRNWRSQLKRHLAGIK